MGAGGRTGFEVVQALTRKGHEVRAVVRNPAKYAGKFGVAEAVKGDVTDAESLITAFAGCDGVVFAASASKYWGAGGPYEVDFLGCKNTADAAVASNVKRLVVVTSRLVHPSNRFHPVRILLNNVKYSLMDYKFEGEAAVRQSGVQYTIVRPGQLMAGEGEKETVAAGTQWIIAGGADADLEKMGPIHRGDVAAVVCEAFTSDDAKNKIVEIASRPCEEGEASFEDRLKTLFVDIPDDLSVDLPFWRRAC